MLSTCGTAYGFAALAPGCVLLLPGAPVAPTSSVNPEGLNFTAGGSHLERQLLQQVTGVVTCANRPLRTGLFSPDFGTPQLGNSRVSAVQSCTQPCTPCTPRADFRLGASSRRPAPAAPPHPNLLWSFSFRARRPSKHALSRTPQAVPEKNVAFSLWAQKTQINN